MPRHARPARHPIQRAAALAGAASRWLIRPLRRRTKTLVLAGTALALASAGSAAVATPSGDPTGSAGQRPRLAADLRPPAARRAAQRPVSSDPVRPAPRMQAIQVTWRELRDTFNGQVKPAARERRPPAADQLMPVGTSGPQVWMPISGPQLANATTIVRQALGMRMGIRSAVIAVATAMQESRLQDLGYGTADSLGLFQQRPSCGWGTAQEIMNPGFAADAFLTALQRYQAVNPAWAAQPLWTSAQGVQKSGVPLAYAQWEAQAASLVKRIAISQ